MRAFELNRGTVVADVLIGSLNNLAGLNSKQVAKLFHLVRAGTQAAFI